MGLTSEFLAGVIEGFYGPPWSQEERFELLDWLSEWELNTYLYAPKDDLRQRAAWREPYSAPEAERLSVLLRRCRKKHICFVYGLSPGLDIRYSERAEIHRLQGRFEQMRSLGCRDFCVLFDDIPEQMRRVDRKRYGSLAAAQAHVANAVFRWLREDAPRTRMFFCPTAYCGRMAEQGVGGKDYLSVLGKELLPDIQVFWTGPEIISHQITPAAARELAEVLRRKPVIWDNLHANDYDGRRFFCGPYAGRAAELKSEVAGVLSNPNNEFPLNYVPVRTLGKFVQSDKGWNPRRAYLQAMREWLRRFGTCGEAISLRDLVLFGDCYYLPHEEGPEAEALYQQAKRAVTGATTSKSAKTMFLKRAKRLREFCLRLTNLRERRLFWALSRRVWELREELDLLERFVRSVSEKGVRKGLFRSDYHLSGTYRGGVVARLQRLLVQHADGTFTASVPGNNSSMNNRVTTLACLS